MDIDMQRIRKHVEHQVKHIMLLHDPDAIIIHTCPKCGWRAKLPDRRLTAIYDVTDLIMNYVEKNRLLLELIKLQLKEGITEVIDA